MTIEILHWYTRAVLYTSNLSDVREALVEAAGVNADLRYADLRNADLRYADLRYADLRYAKLGYADLRYAKLGNADLRNADLGYADLRNADLGYADLRYADLPASYRIASLCFGGWGITVLPTETTIGCEKHPNTSWLAWAIDAPEIAAMHSDAATWWARHKNSVCAVINDVMAEG